MNESLHFYPILVLLCAAVVVVAIFRKLNASAVLGYLVAGAVVGPGGIGLIPDNTMTRGIAEFGVMFLLFIIGLELSWERLSAMRKHVFFVAFAQVAATSWLIAAALMFAGVSFAASLIIGGALALSSTALVMQLLQDKRQGSSPLGRLSLAVLLIQDLAAVPLLVIVPAMASSDLSLLGHELLVVCVKASLALGAILLVGQLLLGKLYRAVASVENPEIFTALTLLIVLGTGFITHEMGLSLPLGAFLAGLLLAETEYRHQVEADVMPFKGIFLGLFFMVIGMSVNFTTLGEQVVLIFTIALAIMSSKAVIVIILCRMFTFPFSVAVQAGLLLSQGGEFAFIVFTQALGNGLIDADWAQILTLAVVMTMALTPVAMAIGEQFARRSESRRRRGAEDLTKEMSDISNHVLILGFGRVGQTIAKLLSTENIPYVAVDTQVSTVVRARKIGLPVYYGDGSRREVLHAIGVERALAGIITLNNAEAAERAVRGMRSATSALPIITRARDLKDVQALEAAGANVAVSEMFEASLQLGGALLKSVGVAEHEISRLTELFRDSDYALARGTLEVKSGDMSDSQKQVQFQQSSVSSSVRGKQEFDI